MADNEIKYLGQEATEQLIQNAKSTATSKVADHNTATDAHSDIRDRLDEIDERLDSYGDGSGGSEQVSFHGITTEGDGSAYTATVAGIDSLVAGASFIMIPHVPSTVVMPTLNVNGLGAKNIRRRLSGSTMTTVAASSISWLYVNKPIRMTYDGNYWIADLNRPHATDIYGTIPITSGGTDASTAEGALTNLGAVGYTEQSLTDEQKAQARANIGIDSILPPYTSENEGQFLRIVNGVPTWVTIPNAEGVSF